MNMPEPAETSLHGRVLLVDDTPANLDLLSRTLEPMGYDIAVATTGESALRVAGKFQPDLILLDIMMPGLDGLATCQRLKEIDQTRDVPIIFVSARAPSDALASGFAAGAVDYISKPFNPDEVRARVGTHLKIAALSRQLRDRNVELEKTIDTLQREMGRRRSAEAQLQAADERLSLLSAREAERWGLDALVGRSNALAGILNSVRRLQTFTSVNVLIHGESGTGKELIARSLHFGSSLSNGPFVPVNCVAIPAELAESMLFGHVRGAFTGATSDRQGFFEQANCGTLFLDEIGDMPPLLQAKLLRVVEDGRITPVGSAHSKKVQVRLVSATNADLQQRVADGSFRQDLYFRMAGFVLNVPSLRDRAADIPLLAEHWAAAFAKEMGLATPHITAAAMQRLSRHPFPGNIRELKNVIERALIEAGDGDIGPEHIHLLPAPAAPTPTIAAEPIPTIPGDDIPLNLEDAENALIKRALAATGGNVAEAARRLGVNRTRIYRRLGEKTP